MTDEQFARLLTTLKAGDSNGRLQKWFMGMVASLILGGIIAAFGMWRETALLGQQNIQIIERLDKRDEQDRRFQERFLKHIADPWHSGAGRDLDRMDREIEKLKERSGG